MRPAMPSRRSGSVLTFVAAAVVLVGATAALYGWVLMLGLGVTHAEFGWPTPPLGWWPSVGLGAIFALLFGGRR